MRSVSNNRCCTDQSLFFASHCCGFVRKLSQCVSVVLSWADDSSWAGMITRNGPDGSVRRNNVEKRSPHGVSDTAVTLTTAAWFSQFSPIDFLFPSFSAAADLDSLKSSDAVPVTHLKLLLFAGGSFSQALCRACSLLSWSWMLQNGTQNTQSSKHKDAWKSENPTWSWAGTDLEAWIQSLYSSYVISGSGSSRRYDFRAPEAEWTRRKCLNAHVHNLYRCVRDLFCYDDHQHLTACERFQCLFAATCST